MTISAQAARSREALLRAARAEFAEHGLAGARTDRIAARAGINKQRIYAYFASKAGLFAAVVAEALNELLEIVPLPEHGSSAERMSEYVAAVAAYHRRQPELLRLLQWEALEQDPGADIDAQRGERYAEKVDRFAAAFELERAQAAHLLLAVIGLAAWPVAMPQLTRLILGESRDAALEKAVEWSAGAAARLVEAQKR